jgi:cyanophycinase-like exopeptidase
MTLATTPPGNQPGLIVLFGSGETSASGRKVWEQVLQRLPQRPKLALLETPAGFELNAAQVIGRVAEFISHRLQNHQPEVQVIPARRRGTPFSPDDPQVVAPLFQADLIFMGPGSPTYAVRQLKDSLAMHILLARHRLGAAIVFASAAVVSASIYALPVYEIYKAGEDLHWKPGLDFFGMYGLPLVFIPHWNNNDGGTELDTSRCFMGQPRFAELMELLPPELTIMGIDEKTALIIHPEQGVCQVAGLGGVTLIHTGPQHHDAVDARHLEGAGLVEVAWQRGGHVHQFQSGESFQLSRIGHFHQPPAGFGLPEEVWQQACQAAQADQAALGSDQPQGEVLALIEQRQAARQRKDYAESDRLREQIARLGWAVQDTPQGQQLVRKN